MAKQTKKIKLNHIAKMEGHTGFVASILKGNVKQARMDTKEGARLIEGILIGRDYTEVPIITGRICGICPIVHFLSTTMAIEQAFGVKINDKILILRKIMEHLQWIHSHALHLYFLSIPDFYEIENDLQFIKKFPKETEAVVRLRQFAIDLVELIGGRVVHPLTIEAGGFKKLPDFVKIHNKLKDLNRIIEDAVFICEFAKKIKFPKINRETENVAVYSSHEYGIINHKLISSKRGRVTPQDLYSRIKEIHQPFEKVVRTSLDGEPYFTGALARINLNFDKLNPLAKKEWKKTTIKIPTYNTFHNVIAQAVEIVHSYEEIRKLFKLLGGVKLSQLRVKVRPKAGEGYGSVEAPRGLLLDYYKFDRQGRVVDANIITPTAQFLANLEADLKVYLPNVYQLSEHERTIKIRALIRAYDPCISCATH